MILSILVFSILILIYMNDSIKIGIIGSDKYNYLDAKIIVFLNMKK